ncbi:MAG: hemolysin family protein [Pyrinomonadaceae bacterium]
MEIEIGLACLLLITLSFLATVDIAFSQLSDVGLRRLIGEASDRPNQSITAYLTEILEDRPRFRFTISAVIQVLLVAVSVLVASVCLRWFAGTLLVLASFLIGVALAGLFRQVIPRLIALHNPERTLLTLLPVFRPLHKVFSLVIPAWRRRPERARRGDRPSPVENGETAVDEDAGGGGDDLQALIDVGEKEGILEEEEGELIHSIIEFGDTRVMEVMTPRTEIVALPVTATVREARDLIIESKYSRLPVYDEQIENVEGIIYVRDLLQYWTEAKEDAAISSLLRPAFFVPETKSVAELLEEMQKAHVQLALVIDEYGGLAGLVTVEDILEEIVGEIEDEDTETDEILEIIEGTDGYYDVLGSTEIGKIERLFDLEIEEDDFTTIAGLVINELGRVPHAGSHVRLNKLDVEVIEADERRINRLRLRRVTEEAVDDEQQQQQAANGRNGAAKIHRTE